MRESLTKIVDYLNQRGESEYEYATSNEDYVSDYDCLVNEQDQSDIEKTIVVDIFDNDNQANIVKSELYSEIVENVAYTWKPIYLLSSPTANAITSFSIGEIESQIDVDDIAETIDVGTNLVKVLLKFIEKGNDLEYCLRYRPGDDYGYLYIDASYDGWVAVVDNPQERLTNAIISYCQIHDYDRKERVKCD